MEDTGIKIRREAAAMAERRRAEVAATIGKWLLWMDLLIALFVYTSIRDGSYFFAYWFVAEGVLALALIAFGSRGRKVANRKLAQLQAAGQNPESLAYDRGEQPNQAA
jgi:hypothetical protein